MKNERDFNRWNNIKKKLCGSNRNLTFYEKEIWWCRSGLNVGSEQDGRGEDFLRPVYTLKKVNSKTFIGIPLTSILREDPTHLTFYFNKKFSTSIISQIKLHDKERLHEFIEKASDYIHDKIKKATVAFIIS